MAILESYKKIIPAPIYHRLEIDLLADIKYRFVHQKLMHYRMTQSQKVRLEIEDYIYNNKYSLLLGKQDKLIQSPKYTDFVLEYEELMSRINLGERTDPADLFNAIYQNIKSSYTGLLRERLLITFLLEGSRRYLAYQLPILLEAAAMMKEPSNKLFLEEYRAKHAKGLKVFPFEFRDEKGNKHTLENYSDKIIIMDFWFTGCLGCLQMPPAINALMEKLKDRKDIVFLSINTDATAEMWLASLKGGKYSCEGQIHLKTIGNRRVDQFILNYNIHTFPQMFIIGKKGLILSTNPIDPRVDQGEDIIKMIETER